MRIGVPKEIKNHEYRVALTPAVVRELCHRGHSVFIETEAGCGVGFDDQAYIEAGAMVVPSAAQIFADCELIIKVKEPQPDECRQLSKGQCLFTFLHLAPDPLQAQLLADSGATCIAYETVTSPLGGLPLLAPMSEVAGRMSIQAGAHHLEKAQGGNGTLLGGVPGVAPGKVLILGGGVVGENAAQMAMGMGADVVLLDKSLPRLRELDHRYRGRLKCVYSTAEAVEQYAFEADLVVGAVLIPGAAAPKLLRREHLSKMKPGAVVVDVAIDQGGCFETSKPTSHQDPTYVVDGVVHYCVSNMPGGVARTSSMALVNATMPFVLALADKGPLQAMLDDEHLRNGLNVHEGVITYQAVAEALNMPFKSALEALHQ